MKRLTPFAKLVLVAAMVGGVFGAYKFSENRGWVDKVVPKNKDVQDIKGTFT